MEEEYHKKFTHRRTIDHGNTFSRWIIENKTGVLPTNSLTSASARSYHHGLLSRTRPDASYIADILPPLAYKSSSAITSLPTKFVHTSINKIKHPVLVTVWTPDGRRLLTGSMSGEFTLWNGMTFNFETIMQAHDNAIRTMVYSNNGEWLLSGDQEGQIKYWQSNFNNVNILNAHREAIRDISFCPNDTKYVTASDDGSLKIWNFNDSSKEETTLTGHGWDVKCCDWHPTLGLIASGSKDNTVKLWDPRSGGKCLTTLHGYKNTVTKMKFQRAGSTQMLLASTSRDHTGRIFDLRMMRDLLVLRGHNSDVSSLAWHPVHPNIITTGTHDGTISHFVLDTLLPENTTSLEPILEIPNAHDWPIWSLSYHPLGHILCSGANDKATRFWCRARPGDETAFDDKYYHEEEKLQQTQHGSAGQTQIQYQQQKSLYGQYQPPPASLPGSNPTIPSGLSQGLPGIPGLSSFSSNAS